MVCTRFAYDLHTVCILCSCVCAMCLRCFDVYIVVHNRISSAYRLQEAFAATGSSGRRAPRAPTRRHRAVGSESAQGLSRRRLRARPRKPCNIRLWYSIAYVISSYGLANSCGGVLCSGVPAGSRAATAAETRGLKFLGVPSYVKE